MLTKILQNTSFIIVEYLVLFSLLLVGAEQQKLAPLEIAKRSVNKEGIIHLNAKSYSRIVEVTPRDYGVLLVLNALHPSVECPLCRTVDEQIHILAKYAVQPQNGKPVFFAHLDHRDGAKIFDERKVRNVPQIFFIPAADEGEEVLEDQFEHSEEATAENFAAFIQKTVGDEFDVNFPPDYVKIGKLTATVMFALALVKLFWKQVSLVVYSRKNWSLLTLVFILLMISGHMWNQIRHPAYIAQRRNGPLKFFVDTTNQQLGVETSILSFLYGLGSFALSSLVVRVPRIQNPILRKLIVVLWTLILFASFSFICYLYRLKNRGYPFKLLL